MAKPRRKQHSQPVSGGVPAELTSPGLESVVWTDPDLVLGFCDAYGLPAPADYMLPSPRACRDHAAMSWAQVNGYVNRWGGVLGNELDQLDIPPAGRARTRARIAALKGK